MTTRRLLLAIAVWVAPLPAVGIADADVVIDTGAEDTGEVTLQPAVAAWNDGDPAVFRLANGAARAVVTGQLSIESPDGESGADLGAVTLAAGEVATVALGPTELAAPVSILRVDLENGGTLQAFAVREDHRPTVSLEVDGSDVRVRADSPAVLSVQVRQRSWLGAVSSERLERPILVADSRSIELGERPWLPGPWWVDVLLVDHSGTETRLTVRKSDLGRDALVAVVLVVLVGLAVALSLRRRSAQPLAN